MERRKFVVNSLSAVAGMTIAEKTMFSGQSKAEDKSRLEVKSGTSGLGKSHSIDSITPDPAQIVLNVKPILVSLIHTGWWEGPCRSTGLTREQEVASSEKTFATMTKMIEEGDLSKLTSIRFMKPTHVIHDESFKISKEAFDILARDAEQADVLFIQPGSSTYQIYPISQKLGKPWIVVGFGYETTSAAAYTRTYGGEGYPVADTTELINTLKQLRARKTLNHTRILYPNPQDIINNASMATSVWNIPQPQEMSIHVIELLKGRLGIDIKFISYTELSGEMERLLSSKEAGEKAGKAADELLNQANKSFIDRQYVVSSFLFKEAVENLMIQYGCNAFTVGCFEFCVSRLPQKWKIVPCMIHSLMRDKQVVGACEGDLGSLVTMRMLMSVSGKACTTGNCAPGDNDTIEINHSVPCTKMNGFDQPGLPYQLGHFCNTGFGTKILVDYMNHNEKTVTVARIGLNADKLLVMSGTLVASGGWNKNTNGCSVTAVIKPPVGQKMHFLRSRLNYGQHISWVFGDYTDEMRQLGEMLNMKVEMIA
jgi:hypothetical protein